MYIRLTVKINIYIMKNKSTIIEESTVRKFKKFAALCRNT